MVQFTLLPKKSTDYCKEYELLLKFTIFLLGKHAKSAHMT